MDKIIKLLAVALAPAATDPERLNAVEKITAILDTAGLHASQLVISTGDGHIGDSSIDWEAVADFQMSEINDLLQEISKLKTALKRAAKPSKVKANVVTDKDGYVVGSWS